METIELASGQTIEVTMCFCDPAANILYITVPNMTFSQVSAIFEVPDNVKTIAYEAEVYEHFTRLAQLRKDGEGIRVNLEAVK